MRRAPCNSDARGARLAAGQLFALGARGRTAVPPGCTCCAAPLRQRARTPCPAERGAFLTAHGGDRRKDLKGSERQDGLQATTFYPGKASGLGRPPPPPFLGQP